MTSDQNQGGGTEIYQKLVDNVEAAKDHQIQMARQFFPMLRDIRNQRFFFEELNRQLSEHNITVTDVTLFDSQRDNQFFLAAESRIYSNSQPSPKTALKSADASTLPDGGV